MSQRLTRSLLVDRLGCTSECYIEVEQKGGGAAGPSGPPSDYAPVLTRYVICVRTLLEIVTNFTSRPNPGIELVGLYGTGS